MRALKNLKTENKEDALKYAYAFMQSKQLNLKECSFVNPKPTQFNSNYLVPRDMYSAVYKDIVPAWEEFKTNQTHLSSIAFTCVACLDKKDQKRIMLTLLGDVVSFTCYGDYEEEAKNLVEDIISIYKSLK